MYMGYCEHSNEPLGSIRDGELFASQEGFFSMELVIICTWIQISFFLDESKSYT
jgi:hypothetical protein